ncbi:MAG TPA: hypothetical protein VFZ17_01030, partial [Acidimicrobiia bacterium]|nr:hypothetical protein [Acidimicrobiia bacterium]
RSASARRTARAASGVVVGESEAMPGIVFPWPGARILRRRRDGLGQHEAMAATDRPDPGDQPLAGGDFASWLTSMRGALRGEHDAVVPCGSCVACCTASQFVHVGPDEHDALAHIPSTLLFPAPGLPRGHVVLGYDEHGCCPMLVDGQCSIYDHRPRACRTYDCRIFTAAGVEPDGVGTAAIAARVRRWRFEYPRDRDRALQHAVRAAAAHARRGGDDTRAVDATAVAVRAIESSEDVAEHER